MDGSGWTVQLLPDGGGRTRVVRLPRRLLYAAAAAALLLALGGGTLLVLGGAEAAERARLARLEERNERLQARLRQADRTVESLTSTLDRVAAQQNRFRLIAGLPLVDAEVQQVGVGGPDLPAGSRLAADRGPGRALSGVGRLLRRAELLHASLREAADTLAARRDLFRSRPSIRPVAPEVSWLSSGYTRSRQHPVLEYDRPHEGMDVSAPAGAPIRATAGGRVTFAGRRPGYGNVIELSHGHGFSTLYAHASEITVRTGERVERGEAIGRVGQSGLTSGPNVHYEVHVDGRPVNPYWYMLDGPVPE